LSGPVIRGTSLQFFLARADKARRSERLREEEAERKAAAAIPVPIE
jgi:hypothetical protein